MENIRLIAKVLATTERVLNPGVHGSETPLYESEIEIALDLIKRLAEYQLLAALPADLKTSLPSIEQIERELGNDAEIWE